jgi:uncharacterized protein (DUF1778 family)
MSAGIESKAERIEIRVTPTVKALLAAAAHAKHTTITDFLLDNGVRAAEEAISSPRVFFASEDGWNAVQRLLDEKETSINEATIKWLKKHRLKE